MCIETKRCINSRVDEGDCRTTRVASLAKGSKFGKAPVLYRLRDSTVTTTSISSTALIQARPALAIGKPTTPPDHLLPKHERTLQSKPSSHTRPTAQKLNMIPLL